MKLLADPESIRLVTETDILQAGMSTLVVSGVELKQVIFTNPTRRRGG